MMIYGALIPNTPAVAARTLLAMFAGPVLTMIAIRFQPGTSQVLQQLAAAEEAGSNILFLAIGTVLTFFATYVLNGLRTELHDARKFGQYRLLKKIGAGGMGEVYMAEHELMKRPCAIKLIKPEAGSDPTALARFEREVRSAASLSHPNSIDIYDYGHSEDGTFYYVMEYLPGMSLEELVRKAGPLPPGRVIYLLRQACAGLAEAHGIGLVHRDLKPANIFIAHRGGETDVAKVLDFGLVKLTQDPSAPALTAELTVSGTPSYMAPEQATGNRDLDVRADVYALGAVAYFALTGQPPFAGESAFAIMMAHARDQVIPPSEVQHGIPADLEAVVLKALEKKPDDRYPNAKEMGRALAACEDASSWGADQADSWWAEVAHSTQPQAETQA
jgi:eukaryotic-like serine/threonine-protein kinase